MIFKKKSYFLSTKHQRVIIKIFSYWLNHLVYLDVIGLVIYISTPYGATFFCDNIGFKYDYILSIITLPAYNMSIDEGRIFL